MSEIHSMQGDDPMTDKLTWIPKGEWRGNKAPRGNNKMESACGRYWVALFDCSSPYPRRPYYGFHANRLGPSPAALGDASDLEDAKALCEADLINSVNDRERP